VSPPPTGSGAVGGLVDLPSTGGSGGDDGTTWLFSGIALALVSIGLAVIGYRRASAR
jgi:hypothetical protein